MCSVALSCSPDVAKLWQSWSVIEQVPSPESVPMTRAAMAKSAGLGETTLKNWSEREAPPPLVTVAAENGRTLYTWGHLRDFCLENPTLTAAPRVLARYHELFVDPPNRQAPRDTDVGEIRQFRSRPSTLQALSDGATLRSVLADLKTQVHEQGVVAAAATKLAHDAGRVQAALLVQVELLELAITGREEPG